MTEKGEPEKIEAYARVFFENYGADELHISFDNEEHDLCYRLYKFFRNLGLEVGSDGWTVIVTGKEINKE